VLVAGKALVHRRHRGLALTHDTGVAWDTLALDRPHGEMLIMVEADLSRHALWPRFEHRQDSVSVVAVAARAELALRQLVSAIALGYGVTARARKAGGLARRPAFEARQVERVRKARRRPIGAGCDHGGRE
jgi:hypothetical protein